MNAHYVDNNRRGRHPGMGNTPTVYYMDKLPMSFFMSEWRSLVTGDYYSGGIRHGCRGPNSEY